VIRMEFYYRYRDYLASSGLNEYDLPTGPPQVKLQLMELPLIKLTPKGAWVNYYGTKKFVLNTSKRRFAHPTKEEAKQAFIKRKHRQISILTAQLRNAQRALRFFEPLELPEVFNDTNRLSFHSSLCNNS